MTKVEKGQITTEDIATLKLYDLNVTERLFILNDNGALSSVSYSSKTNEIMANGGLHSLSKFVIYNVPVLTSFTLDNLCGLLNALKTRDTRQVVTYYDLLVKFKPTRKDTTLKNMVDNIIDGLGYLTQGIKTQGKATDEDLIEDLVQEVTSIKGGDESLTNFFSDVVYAVMNNEYFVYDTSHINPYTDYILQNETNSAIGVVTQKHRPDFIFSLKQLVMAETDLSEEDLILVDIKQTNQSPMNYDIKYKVTDEEDEYLLFNLIQTWLY